MALYTPQSQRRRRLVVAVAVAFLLGGVLGGLLGRLTAPTVAEQVAQVQEQAREISAQLRVLSLHAAAGAASLDAGGDAGTGLALQRADQDLAGALGRAPWIAAGSGRALQNRLHELQRSASTRAATSAFAADVDRLASDIDATFGVSAPS
ncbi:MAG TPA: hypothetical protein VFQ77_19790 [Pseudonocardiaceae bacterium]|nr:hypothetical protein [Pseudonocardiaceae bacterium]